MTAVTADDRTEMLALWPQIESKLLAHLEAEERFVLPAFARTDRKEALELMREHGKIRELLLELGVSIELHYARMAPFQLFIAMLREHAQREETLMYRWASTMLDSHLATAATKHANGEY
jgi:hemerythrin superfamily protein